MTLTSSDIRRSGGDRERVATEAFVMLTDPLVDGYDIADRLDRLSGYCVELLAVDAVGILLADADQQLRLVASTDERSDRLELLQLEAGEGPSVDCYRTGDPVDITDLAVAGTRWPRFACALARPGAYGSVHVLPLRLRGDIIGTLSLSSAGPGPLPAADLVLGRALADVATAGILAERTVTRGRVVVEQLQTALDSRVVIEQAKGVLAERGRTSVGDAFDRLRRYARHRNLRLAALAREVVETDLAADVLATCPPARRA